MNNKQYRLKELINPIDGRGLIFDTSNGLVFGALPGLEQFGEALAPLLPLLDGVVTSPGQARNLGLRTREQAALIVRSDWTNALRGDDFVLPPENVEYLPLLEVKDTLDLGANALVMHFILGFEEEIEAQCLKRAVNLALDGLSLGMPLIVDVQPIGPRVVLMNKAIELGVSYALESGADGIAIPWPGTASFETIQTMCSSLPVWVKPASLEADSPKLTAALEHGAAGFWLDERIFVNDDPPATMQALHAQVHPLVEISVGGAA
jgi:DhnA family fructose-bisphosphate aldolase class Ia